MPVVPMFTRELRRRRLATAPTLGHARLGRAIHAARGRRGARPRGRGGGGSSTGRLVDWTVCSSACEDVDAVDLELDSDQRLAMVEVLLRPAVIRGSWWWWCSDRVDAVEGDPPQPDG